MERGRPVSLSDHSSLIPPLCLRDDLVQSSNNKTAYSNPSCGTYLGSHRWPTLREEGAASAMPARQRVRKRPRMAPAQFFSWRDGAVCLVSGIGLSTPGYLHLSSSLSLSLPGRLSHSMSEYCLHTQTHCVCTSALSLSRSVCHLLFPLSHSVTISVCDYEDGDDDGGGGGQLYECLFSTQEVVA